MNINLTNDQSTAPTRAHHDDAGLDCYARQPQLIRKGETYRIPLGFAVALPEGFEMQIRGRSSLSARGILCHLGTIDAGYRGEIAAILTNLGDAPYQVEKGARIAQAVIARYISVPLHVVDSLPPSFRGTGGFGSTGA